MNKSELVNHIATEADISNAAATRALDAMMGAITEALVNGRALALVGFGSFSIAQTPEHKGAQPINKGGDQHTGGPGKALKDAVNS